MAAGWIEAVRALWVQDADIDFAALEDAWKLKTFETSGGSLQDAEAASRAKLLCCLTGFEDGELRQNMIETIMANGADYTGDLTRKVTHLIVNKPEGKKYAAAKSWNVLTVAIEWLHDSVERGMILDEKCYDPVLPPEERGKGAWTKREVKRVSLGKRLRDTAAAAEGEGRRKLRKTASMKLSSQRDNMWGDILGKPPSVEPQTRPDEEPTQPNPRGSFQTLHQQSFDTQGSKLASFGQEEVAVFASCCFYVHGFPQRHAEIVVTYISSLGGLICESIDDVATNSGAQMAHRFMIVPQTSKLGSYPTPPENIQVVTEFFVEKCMHKKQFFNPASHVIGRPFSVFPISGFETLSISTAGCTGVDLNHMDKAIRQLGARYDERFRVQTSLLVCNSLSNVRKQKLDLALQWKVPVVSANWLWTCIADGIKVPIKRFLFKELRQRLVLEDESREHRAEELDQPRKPARRTETLQEPAEPAQKQPARLGVRDIDNAFVVDKPFPVDAAAITRKEVTKDDSNLTSEFQTAPTHLSNEGSPTTITAAPLSEASTDSLNKPSSQQPRIPPPPEPRDTSNLETLDAQDTATDHTNPVTNENIPLPAPNLPKEKAEKETADKEKATLKTAARLALSARLTTLLDPPAPAPAKRRRQILGRATSNVSAASSGSESVALAPASALSAPDGFVGGDGLMGAGGAADGGEGEGRDTPMGSDRQLSSTQLQYEDPEAERQKERLKGGKGGAGARVVAEKITLASAGGYDVVPVDGSGVGRAAGRSRSTRR